jgi:hypothetical protein
MKNSRIITVAIAFLLLGTTTMAQTAKTEITGSTYKLKTNERVTKVLGSDQDGFYTLSSTQGTGFGMEELFIIQKYDASTLTKKWSKEFSLNVSSEPLEGVFFVKDKVIAMYATYEKSDKTKTLNFKVISSTGEMKDVPAKEARIKTGMFDFGKRDFYFTFSPDSTKILATSKFQDKKKPEDITTVLLDVNDFKKIWEKSIPNSFNNNQTITHNYRVDNSGNLFYLAGYLNGEVVNNVFCEIKAGASTPSYIPLNLETGRVSNSDLFYRLKEYALSKAGISLIENANEISYEFIDGKQLLIAGIFKDFKQGKAGVFQYTIDIDGEKSTGNKEQLFEAPVDQQINGIGKAKNSNGYDYSISKVVTLDGSLLVFASIFKIKGYNNGMTLLTDRYDDLIFALKPSMFTWSATLPGDFRDVGTEKNIDQTYSKNGKLYMCFGIPESKKISGTALETFTPQFESAKKQNNNLSFIEISDKGFTNVYGYSLSDKHSSILLIDNFLTLKDAFLLPLTDFNSITGASSSIQFTLVGIH